MLGWPTKKRDEDLERELRSDLELEEEEQRERGLSEEEARYAARRAFGNETLIWEQTREAWGWGAVESFLRDLRLAWRVLVKSPIFAISAVVTLALGIGATTAIFSAMNAILLRRIPVPDPQRIVYLTVPNGQPDGASNTGDSESSFSLPVFESLRREHRVFADLMAFVPLSNDKVDVRAGNGQPEQASGEMVSGNFFSGLGVSAIRGRVLSLDDEAHHTAVAVLSYRFWTRRFSRDPAVLGQTLYVKGIPFTIAGIAAEGFPGVEPGEVTDFWIPLQRRTELSPWGASGVSLYGSPDWWCLRLIARFAPGVTPEQAVAGVTPVLRAAAFADLKAAASEQEKLKLVLAPARGLEGLGNYDTEPIRILMALVALVLMIACGNVAMLIVARNASRQHDFSLRMALGASRRSLFRQLLAESALLVFAGGSLGWIFALFATRALAAWAHIETGLAPDRTVLLFTTAIAILATVVFSLAPLRMVARAPVTGNLRTASGISSAGGRAGSVVLAAQVALCFTLLTSAGLLLRTLLNYESTSLGMRMEGLLVFGITPQQATSNAERFAFYRNLLDRMQSLPGVEAATIMGNRLGSGWSTNDEPTIDGVTHPFEQVPLRENEVGPDYLHTLGIPILAGRDLSDADTPSSPRVVIVNETFVRKLLPNTNPLGQRLGGFNDRKEAFTIVGVARDSKYRSVDEAPRAMAYFPYEQMGAAPATMQVELRVHGDPLAMLPSVERAVHGIDANLPLEKPMSQAAVFEDSYSDQRLFARVSVFFGLLAALLVSIGLYGALAYRVSRRTGEIGVRLALGAQRKRVLRLVLGDGVRPALYGLAAGLAASAGAVRLIQSMLYATRPLDPVVFVAVAATLLAVAGLACLVPAWRASRIDPMQALRMD